MKNSKVQEKKSAGSDTQGAAAAVPQKQSVWKMILAKLPVFLYCVVFMAVYSTVFGKENSLAGVILLTCSLMYLKADFGLPPSLTALLIPAMLTAIGVLAHLSDLYPVWAPFISAATIASILYILRGEKTHTLYLPLILGYLMFRGMPVSGEAYGLRILSLFSIGCVIGLVNWLIMRGQKPVVSVECSFSLDDPYDQWAVTLTASVVMAVIISNVLGLDKGMWLELAVFSMIQPEEEASRLRIRDRIPGTLIGCLVFYVVFVLLVPEQYMMAALLTAGFLGMFFTNNLAKASYNTCMALTAAVLLFPIKTAIGLRLLMNVIGLALAMLSTLMFTRIFQKRLERKKKGATERL